MTASLPSIAAVDSGCPASSIDERQVIEVVDDFRRHSAVPGVAVSLFTRAGVVAQVGRGVASVEAPDVAMTPSTVGRAYSLSKVMTGTALAVLAAAGRADLDEPVAQHLPDAPGRDRFATTTLRHLLSHSSGLVHGPLNYTSVASSRDPLEQYVLAACLGAPRVGDPGQVFGYSDTGIVLAGYLLQRITGRPFGQAMADALFAPAGMTRTTFDPLMAMTFPLSQQHLQTAPGSLTVRRRFGFHPMTLPSTGAFTCVADLARLGLTHLRVDPNGPLLTASVAAELHAPLVDVGLDIVREYGLTLARGPWLGDVISLGHEGYDEGGWAKLHVVPDLGIGVAWLDNTGDDPELRPRRHACVEQLLGLLGAGPRSWRRPDDPVRVDPDQAAGTYARPNGRPVMIGPGPHGLRASHGAVTLDFRPLTGRVFVAVGDVPAQVPWTPDRDSKRSSLCLVGPPEAPTHILLNGLPYPRR